MQFVTERAEKTLAAVYSKISQAYRRRPGEDGLEHSEQLQNVKRTLAATKNLTSVDFLCFKRPRAEKDASSVKGASGANAERIRERTESSATVNSVRATPVRSARRPPVPPTV
jgi:exocyst complex component 2